jgi:hypothetical protein
MEVTRVVEEGEMEQIFNLQEIRKLLDSEEWEDDRFNDCQKRTIYIGSVFALLPSGKYYMPWACSNVTEEEADKDADWYTRAESELATIRCFMESGEGDPCDLFVGENRDMSFVEE